MREKNIFLVNILLCLSTFVFTACNLSLTEKILTENNIADDTEGNTDVENGINMETNDDSVDIPESYKVTPRDADAYYENNSKVVSVIDIQDSSAVHTEAETYDNLSDRGFSEYSITSEYSMDGTYYPAIDISDSSSTKHPMYQTYYVTASGDIWTVFEINGVVMANPVSYNLQSDLDVQVIISETDTVTSYDSATNKYYVTIPNELALIVKTVNRIDAETLENLTIEGIDGL